MIAGKTFARMYLMTRQRRCAKEAMRLCKTWDSHEKHSTSMFKVWPIVGISPHVSVCETVPVDVEGICGADAVLWSASKSAIEGIIVTGSWSSTSLPRCGNHGTLPIVMRCKPEAVVAPWTYRLFKWFIKPALVSRYMYPFFRISNTAVLWDTKWAADWSDR